MSSDQSVLTNPLLPFRFTASNAAASDATSDIDITVVRALASISISSLNPEIFTSRKTVFISGPSLEKIGPAHSVFLVKAQTQQTEGIRHGVLIKCGFLEGVYELLDGSISPLNLDPSEDIDRAQIAEVNSLATAGEFLDLWALGESEENLNTQIFDRTSFTMKPPVMSQLSADVAAVPKHYMISPQHEKNPLDFILSRYYNTLYSLTTPLSYFPKTALSRFKNMCNHEPKQMLECLSVVYLTPAQLDQRRSLRYGLSKTSSATAHNSVQYSRFEVQNQELFVSKNFPDNMKEDVFESLVLDLKIREAQLQILILLEILVCSEIEEVSFLETNAKKEEKESRKSRKPRLVRRKQKAVIPTFLGVGVPEMEADAEPGVAVATENGVLSPATLYTSLATLIDQIGLWDSLSDRVKSDKEQNTHGFLAFVVIPYFSKTLPAIVQFIVKNFKGLRPNLSRPKKTKRDKEKDTQSAPDIAPETDVVIPDPDIQLSPPASDFTRSLSSLDDRSVAESKIVDRRSKFTKTLMKSEKFPLLNRAMTSIDTDCQPAFSLKRSKSNLGAKNLKRRQVDISVAKPEPPEIEAQRSASFLFMDARKIKSASNLSFSHNATAVVRQVEATPAKPLKSSKSGALFGKNQPSMDAPQVFATPSNRRTLDMNLVVEETPQNTQDKRPSVRDRISQIAKSVPEHANPVNITSSPVQDSDPGRMFSNGRLGSIDSSSPVKLAISSPVSVKTKPGQVISLSQSPFYSGHLDGSPPFKTAGNRASPLAAKKAGPEKMGKSGKSKSSQESVSKKAEVQTKATRKKSVAGASNKVKSKREAESNTVMKPPVSSAPAGVASSEREAVSTSTESKGNILAKSGDTETAQDDGSGSDAGSDSDSDYERLLAAVQRPAPKKYAKKRGY